MSETLNWAEGLDRRLLQAKSFYGTIAVATLAGISLNFTSLNPVKALYWSAVVNGILAAPVMAVIMLVASNRRIMGRLTVSAATLQIGGWLATVIMLAASIAFLCSDSGHNSRCRRDCFWMKQTLPSERPF